MITKSDAIKLGKEIVQPALLVMSEPNNTLRHTMRGTVIIILDGLWYNVFDDKLKKSFNYNKDTFYAESGWV